MSECNGTISVNSYTRSDGVEVAAYERTCPYYPHEDKDTSEKNKEQKLKLSSPFSSNRTTQPTDVMELKKVLADLGYYKANTKNGEAHIKLPDGRSISNFHQYSNSQLVDAVKAFQRDQGLRPDGALNPGGETEGRINQMFSKNRISQKEDKQNVKNMKTSDKGLEYIRQYERFSEKPYDDGTGRMTIGYGHVIKKNECFESISKTEAIKLFQEDLKESENAIKSYVKTDLSQKQFDALASFIYNAGAGNFSSSTFLRYLNNDNFISEKYPNMESSFKAFNKAYNPKTNKVETSEGLINRRDDDWNIFKFGNYKIKK